METTEMPPTETPLTKTAEELVAIGASIGSNCVPCLAYHVRQAREAGMSEAEIAAAVGVALRVKESPARIIADTVHRLLGFEVERASGPKSACCR